MSPRTIRSATREPRDSVQAIVAGGGISKLLERTGRLPPISLIITPLDGSPKISLDRFLTYQFQSSILIPVDTFSFNFVAPDDPKPLNKRIKEGDIVTLIAAGKPLATGIIDSTELETDQEFGEKATIVGRDLMSQLEDQDAISIDDSPIWGNEVTVDQAVRKLSENTRITKFQTQSAPKKPYLLASEPGESKLAVLQRFLEPLNCLAWTTPSGALVVGRPNMAQKPLATLVLSKSRRESNVISMRAVRKSTPIPNAIIPIWVGQEKVVDVLPSQKLLNPAKGPDRLRKLNHRVSKTVVVPTPNGNSPQELSGVNAIAAGGSNLLQAYAKREFARRNVEEMIVQVLVPGHFNENGQPYQFDQVYMIDFERGDVREAMYLYEVDYMLTEDGGQRSVLKFCRLGRIVSDVVAP